MLKVGLTGGIGSGKTTIARVFEVLGVPVYYADTATKYLMNTNETLKTAIIEHFGNESYSNGQLNRSYISSIVFNDKEKLLLLNSLTHPVTINDANEWMKRQTTAYIIKEAALLFESGADKVLDYVIGVDAPASLRIQRVMERDNVSAEEVLNRMKNQMDEDAKIKRCDFIIHNKEEKLVVPQIIELHEKLMQLATS